MKVRFATTKDTISILKIYEEYIDTPITFEYKLPTEKEFEERIKEIIKEYPYIVCEQEGKVVGYAYAHKYKERKAYDFDVELSIYISKSYTSKGEGKKLYNIYMEHSTLIWPFDCKFSMSDIFCDGKKSWFWRFSRTNHFSFG